MLIVVIDNVPDDMPVVVLPLVAVAKFAFANTAGLNQIKDDLLEATKHIKKWAVVVGIDFITSKEALEILLELEVNTKVFSTRTPTKTFHPKIFLSQLQLNYQFHQNKF